MSFYHQVYADDAKEWHIQTQENLVSYRPECASSLSISDEAVAEYKKWNFPDDEKTRCYIRCIFNKMGLFEDATGFYVDRLVKQLGQNREEAEVRTEVLKCADKNPGKDDACIWAFRGFNCFKAAHLPLIQTSVKKNWELPAPSNSTTCNELVNDGAILETIKQKTQKKHSEMKWNESFQ